MLKKRISYTDYNGVTKEKDFYFNLSEAELIKMDFSTNGGLEATLTKIMEEQDMPTLYAYFEKIVQSSYGVKSLDGDYFEKSPEILQKFVQSPAYDKLILELIGSADGAAAFVNGILPQNLNKANGAALPGKAPVVGVITPNA